MKLPRIYPQTYTSQAFIKAQIQAQALANWQDNWIQNPQGTHYKQFNTTPIFTFIKAYQDFPRRILTTITQLKLGHGYFKSYLSRLPQYNTDLCSGTCKEYQNPEHLLFKCNNYKVEQRQLKNNISPLPTTIRTLLGTRKGLEEVRKYLEKTKIATRQWILGLGD